MMCIFAGFSLLEPAYIIAKIVQVYADASRPPAMRKYAGVWKLAVVTLGVCTVIIRLVVSLYAVRVVRNFGKGLREALVQLERIERRP